MCIYLYINTTYNKYAYPSPFRSFMRTTCLGARNSVWRPATTSTLRRVAPAAAPLPPRYSAGPLSRRQHTSSECQTINSSTYNTQSAPIPEAGDSQIPAGGRAPTGRKIPEGDNSRSGSQIPARGRRKIPEGGDSRSGSQIPAGGRRAARPPPTSPASTPETDRSAR